MRLQNWTNPEQHVFARGDKWIFRNPGFQRFDGERLIEAVPHQDFEHDTKADALGHADYELNPELPWFPPPPC